MYFNTCEHCGANLDPGEPCDCRKDRPHTIKRKPAAPGNHLPVKKYKKEAASCN